LINESKYKKNISNVGLSIGNIDKKRNGYNLEFFFFSQGEKKHIKRANEKEQEKRRIGKRLKSMSKNGNVHSCETFKKKFFFLNNV